MNTITNFLYVELKKYTFFSLLTIFVCRPILSTLGQTIPKIIISLTVSYYR